MGAIDHTDASIAGIAATFDRFLIYGSNCNAFVMLHSAAPYADFPSTIIVEWNGNARSAKKSYGYAPYITYGWNNCGDTNAIRPGAVIMVNLK
jgi:hypothetical protein